MHFILSITYDGNYEEVTRPASLVNKDEEDAFTCSENNGDRLMEKEKPKSFVWNVFGYKPNSIK